MKRIFINYVTMFRLLVEDFKDKRFIRTQTLTRRLKKVGQESGLKIFSQTWNNLSRNLMRGKSFQFNARNDFKIRNKDSIHTLNQHILIKDWMGNSIDTIRTKIPIIMFLIKFTYNHIITCDCSSLRSSLLSLIRYGKTSISSVLVSLSPSQVFSSTI